MSTPTIVPTSGQMSIGQRIKFQAYTKFQHVQPFYDTLDGMSDLLVQNAWPMQHPMWVLKHLEKPDAHLKFERPVQEIDEGIVLFLHRAKKFIGKKHHIALPHSSKLGRSAAREGNEFCAAQFRESMNGARWACWPDLLRMEHEGSWAWHNVWFFKEAEDAMLFKLTFR